MLTIDSQTKLGYSHKDYWLVSNNMSFEILLYTCRKIELGISRNFQLL